MIIIFNKDTSRYLKDRSQIDGSCRNPQHINHHELWYLLYRQVAKAQTLR